jgi:hypothetical protein
MEIRIHKIRTDLLNNINGQETLFGCIFKRTVLKFSVENGTLKSRTLKYDNCSGSQSARCSGDEFYYKNLCECHSYKQVQK